MNALDNKHILQTVFAELAVSNAKPFVDLMAENSAGFAPVRGCGLGAMQASGRC